MAILWRVSSHSTLGLTQSHQRLVHVYRLRIGPDVQVLVHRAGCSLAAAYNSFDISHANMFSLALGLYIMVNAVNDAIKF